MTGSVTLQGPGEEANQGEAQRDTPRIKSNSEVANFGNNRKSQKYLGGRLEDVDGDVGGAEVGRLKVE